MPLPVSEVPNYCAKLFSNPYINIKVCLDKTGQTDTYAYIHLRDIVTTESCSLQTGSTKIKCLRNQQLDQI